MQNWTKIQIYQTLQQTSKICTPPLPRALGNLISHIFRENDLVRDIEWERYFNYKNIEIPDDYSGPHLTFPLTTSIVTELVEAFRNKQVSLHLTSYPVDLYLKLYFCIPWT